jgi:pantothenate kinase
VSEMRQSNAGSPFSTASPPQGETEQVTSAESSPFEAGSRRVVEASIEDLAVLVRTLAAARAGRTMLGLVGAPGAGKSTLASALAERLGDLEAVVVPFDGFHLANATLTYTRLQHRKGALETFDLDGYAHLLQRLREARGTVYAPAYDRSIEEPIAGAVTVGARSRLVITEGNYLLADHPDAVRARRSLDAVWFIDLDERTRTRRLVRRHVEFGKTPSQAQDWAAGSDQRNAELVKRTRDRADLVVRLIDSPPARHP